MCPAACSSGPRAPVALGLRCLRARPDRPRGHALIGQPRLESAESLEPFASGPVRRGAMGCRDRGSAPSHGAEPGPVAGAGIGRRMGRRLGAGAQPGVETPGSSHALRALYSGCAATVARPCFVGGCVRLGKIDSLGGQFNSRSRRPQPRRLFCLGDCPLAWRLYSMGAGELGCFDRAPSRDARAPGHPGQPRPQPPHRSSLRQAG